MNRCRGIVVTRLGGGTRSVSGCDSPPIAGSDFCWTHKQEDDYQKREFQRMMANASRHRRGVKVHNRGTWCSCGTFVGVGVEHPWDVPVSVEDAQHSGD